jgi:hypothetical protein
VVPASVGCYLRSRALRQLLTAVLVIADLKFILT